MRRLWYWNIVNQGMKKIVSIVMFLFVFVCLQAQVPNISVPFSFGFEESDSLMLKSWHISEGSDTSVCKERWFVGTYVRTEGRRSLYISGDEGITSEYDTVVNTTYAYFDFTIPAGQYEL